MNDFKYGKMSHKMPIIMDIFSDYRDSWNCSDRMRGDICIGECYWNNVYPTEGSKEKQLDCTAFPDK